MGDVEYLRMEVEGKETEDLVLGLERIDSDTVVTVGLKYPDSDQWLLCHLDADGAIEVGQALIKKGQQLLAAQMEDV